MPDLKLTPEQVDAAKACGCALLPATEDQLHRLRPQRRIFDVSGQPFVVTRGDGFYETAGTLLRLIERHAAGMPSGPAARAEAAPADPVPPQRQDPPQADAEPAMPDSAGDTPEVPPPAEQPRAPRARRKAAMDADATPPEEMPRRVDEAAGRMAEAGRARSATHRRGPTELPRWATAGAARRGRLRQRLARG